MFKDRGRKTDDRRQTTEDGRQRTEDGGQWAEGSKLTADSLQPEDGGHEDYC